MSFADRVSYVLWGRPTEPCFQPGSKGRLIVLDGENVIPALLNDGLRDSGLGQQGIGRDNAPCKVNVSKKSCIMPISLVLSEIGS